jgi:hypothetical protein
VPQRCTRSRCRTILLVPGFSAAIAQRGSLLLMGVARQAKELPVLADRPSCHGSRLYVTLGFGIAFTKIASALLRLGWMTSTSSILSSEANKRSDVLEDLTGSILSFAGLAREPQLKGRGKSYRTVYGHIAMTASSSDHQRSSVRPCLLPKCARFGSVISPCRSPLPTLPWTASIVFSSSRRVGLRQEMRFERRRRPSAMMRFEFRCR